jgi:hypothetical protein
VASDVCLTSRFGIKRRLKTAVENGGRKRLGRYGNDRMSSGRAVAQSVSEFGDDESFSLATPTFL